MSWSKVGHSRSENESHSGPGREHNSGRAKTLSFEFFVFLHPTEKERFFHWQRDSPWGWSILPVTHFGAAPARPLEICSLSAQSQPHHISYGFSSAGLSYVALRVRQGCCHCKVQEPPWSALPAGAGTNNPAHTLQAPASHLPFCQPGLSFILDYSSV